jgi:aspartate/methionine/tyrosine aminotransferase
MQRFRRIGRDFTVSRGPEIHLHRLRVAKAREAGVDVIDLGFADVFAEPPAEALASCESYFTRDKSLFHYGPVQGLETLRCAVADYLSGDCREVSPDNVIITAGGNHGVVVALMATTVPGDQVVIPAPFFFNHVTQLQLVGCSPHLLITHPEDNYMFTEVSWERALAQREVGAALLTDPRNPTATQMRDVDVKALMLRARERGRPVIVDESYREFSSDSDRAGWGKEDGLIRVGSLSKSFCLAGWRIGYMVVPESLRDDVIRAQDALMIHPAIASQQVALSALKWKKTDDYVSRLTADIASRRLYVGERLLACEWIERVFSDAGTYVWVQLSTEQDADRVAELLLTECGVAVLSGMAFGRAGSNCLRIGVGCVSREELELGLDRLISWRGE